MLAGEIVQCGQWGKARCSQDVADTDETSAVRAPITLARAALSLLAAKPYGFSRGRVRSMKHRSHSSRYRQSPVPVVRDQPNVLRFQKQSIPFQQIGKLFNKSLYMLTFHYSSNA